MAKAEIKFGELSGGGVTAVYDSAQIALNASKRVECGFEPKHIVLYFIYNNANPIVYDVDVDADVVYRAYNNSRSQYTTLHESSMFSVDSSGFTFTSPYNNYTFYWLASKD